MIKISELKANVIRETTAEVEIFEDGASRKETIRIQYYSRTIGQLKEHHEQIQARLKEDENAVVWVSDSLAKRLHALPDFVDENGKPVEITVELLDSFVLENLKAIEAAIEADENPKESSAE